MVARGRRRPTLTDVQTRYLILVSLAAALVILVAGAVWVVTLT
jgi:hypothetical protein